MPKIIENIRDNLLYQAKKQISEQGYAKTTIRSVADACGLGVGTVYNYFKSKDHLIATFMAEDWISLLNDLKSNPQRDDRKVLYGVFLALVEFSQKYRLLFCDKDAEKVFMTAFSQRHGQLRKQIADIIRPICNKPGVEDDEFMSEHIAESLLTWTIAGKSFDEQYQILSKLLK